MKNLKFFLCVLCFFTIQLNAQFTIRNNELSLIRSKIGEIRGDVFYLGYIPQQN
jgi:hypothetical protein